MLFKNKKKRICTFVLVIMLTMVMVVSTACGGSANTSGKPTLVLAEPDWESVRFHNEIVRFIIEEGYGYPTDTTPGSTPVTFLGLRQGDIDIYTEVWTDNISDYQEALELGDVKELAVNFDDDYQGIYVPTYVIKGDPARGIKALAPDLKSVEDLDKYWEIFRDPEDNNKGRIIGALPGWAADVIVTEKVAAYGLDKNYNLFRPGSAAALDTSIVQAYEKGEPWLGFYWEPTWIVGKYDMTLLEEAPYNAQEWAEGNYRTAFPAVRVTVCVNKDMETKAPEIVNFLSNYETSSAITSEGLAYMQENNVGPVVAAKWFFENYQEMWKSWVPEDIAQKIEAAL